MTVQELHNKAIDLADYAFIEKFAGRLEHSVHLFKEAYQLEREAALMAKEQNVGEPSVSVLLKSAASLAINANELNEAEELRNLLSSLRGQQL